MRKSEREEVGCERFEARNHTIGKRGNFFSLSFFFLSVISSLGNPNGVKKMSASEENCGFQDKI